MRFLRKSVHNVSTLWTDSNYSAITPADFNEGLSFLKQDYTTGGGQTFNFGTKFQLVNDYSTLVYTNVNLADCMNTLRFLEKHISRVCP